MGRFSVYSRGKKHWGRTGIEPGSPSKRPKDQSSTQRKILSKQTVKKERPYLSYANRLNVNRKVNLLGPMFSEKVKEISL